MGNFMGVSENVVSSPLYPMVLLIIIPFLNGYFIGNIPYFQTHFYGGFEQLGDVGVPEGTPILNAAVFCHNFACELKYLSGRTWENRDLTHPKIFLMYGSKLLTPMVLYGFNFHPLNVSAVVTSGNPFLSHTQSAKLMEFFFFSMKQKATFQGAIEQEIGIPSTSQSCESNQLFAKTEEFSKLWGNMSELFHTFPIFYHLCIYIYIP